MPNASSVVSGFVFVFPDFPHAFRFQNFPLTPALVPWFQAREINHTRTHNCQNRVPSTSGVRSALSAFQAAYQRSPSLCVLCLIPSPTSPSKASNTDRSGDLPVLYTRFAVFPLCVSVLAALVRTWNTASLLPSVKATTWANCSKLVSLKTVFSD